MFVVPAVVGVVVPVAAVPVIVEAVKVRVAPPATDVLIIPDASVNVFVALGTTAELDAPGEDEL